jgi:hypothetical protein
MRHNIILWFYFSYLLEGENIDQFVNFVMGNKMV